jgi:hypothetical protein
VKRALNAVVGTLSIVGPVGVFVVAFGQSFLPEKDLLLSLELFDVLHYLLGGICLALMLGFILSCSTVVPAGKRGLWVVVLLTANIVAVPFFWFWYVRPFLTRDSIASA